MCALHAYLVCICACRVHGSINKTARRKTATLTYRLVGSLEGFHEARALDARLPHGPVDLLVVKNENKFCKLI